MCERYDDREPLGNGAPAPFLLELVLHIVLDLLCRHGLLEPSQYLWADLPYPDPQLIDLHHLVCAAHAFLICSTHLHRVYRYRLLKERKMVLS